MHPLSSFHIGLSTAPTEATEQRLWTASTCARVLRPLQSHVVQLEKAARQKRAADQQPAPQHEQKAAEDDPSQEVFSSHARARRTYCSRRKVSPGSRQAPSSGAIDYAEVLPTPYKKAATPTTDEQHEDAAAGRPQASASSRTTRKPKPPALSSETAPPKINDESSANLCQGFIRVLHDLNSYAPVKVGAPSLLASALRTYGDVVEEEEAELRAAKPHHDSDVSAAKYEELESHAPTDKIASDWLKQVSRAHAVALMARAMRSDLVVQFDSATARAGCIKLGATDAIRSLAIAAAKSELAHATRRLGLDGIGAEGQTPWALSRVDSVLNAAGSCDLVMFINLIEALYDKALSVHALVSRDAHQARLRAVRAITSPSETHLHAHKLAKNMFAVACGIEPQLDMLSTERVALSMADDISSQRMQQEVCKALEMMLVSLVSTSLMGPRTTGLPQEKKPAFQPEQSVRETAGSIIRIMSDPEALRKIRSGSLARTMSMVLLADLFVLFKMSITATLEKRVQTQQRIDCLLALVTQSSTSSGRRTMATSELSKLLKEVAGACGSTRLNGKSPLEFLTISLLQSVGGGPAEDMAKQIAMDAGLTFATSGNDLGEEAFIKSLEDTLNLKLSPSPEGATGAHSSRYEWDDTLCEFKARKTPAKRTQARPSLGRKHSIDLVDDDGQENVGHGARGHGGNVKRAKLKGVSKVTDLDEDEDEDELALGSVGLLTDVTNRTRAL